MKVRLKLQRGDVLEFDIEPHTFTAQYDGVFVMNSLPKTYNGLALPISDLIGNPVLEIMEE